jgi:meiotic recombination protein REC8
MISSQELVKLGEASPRCWEYPLTHRRPEQLILMDDPAFLPETALPALDFDLASLERSLPRGSQLSSESMMSIHGRNRSNSTPQAVGGLHLPSSSTHAGLYQLPLDDPFIGSSAQRLPGSTGNGLFDDEGEYFQDDMIFEFDANGEMRDIDASEREARRAGRVNRGRIGSDSTGSGRVRKEHDDGIVSRIVPILDADGDLDTANFHDDDVQALPEAEPYPMMSGALGVNDNPQHLHASEDHVHEASSPELVSSNSADAALKSRKANSRKTLGADRFVELRNTDLIKWQAEYKNSMAAATHQVIQRKANAQAKKNAFWYIWGAGLNGVGNGVGTANTPSPLDTFSGESLLSKATGKSIPSATSKSKKNKRILDTDDEPQVTPKRARQFESEKETERANLEDDQGMMMVEDGSIGMEIGREAPSALLDHPSSAMMPWNTSASLNAYQRGASSTSHHGRGLDSTGRRLLSASPLVGRGSALPGPLEQFLMQDDKVVTYGDDDDQGRGPEPSFSQMEFEIFGPAAQVDTQTAEDSQWVRDALAREAGNFFEYVLNTISEKGRDVLGEEERHVGAAEKDMFVTFEELFDPTRNSRIVAAQAFYHVLSLVTKNRVWVEQAGDVEPFGPIRIGVIG